MYNAPESEYTPEVRRTKIQAANFLVATGKDKEVARNLEKRINDAKVAGIAADAKTQALWEKEETEKVLKTQIPIVCLWPGKLHSRAERLLSEKLSGWTKELIP